VKPILDDAGVKLVAVGIGDVDKAREFCRETGFPADAMYADDGEMYREIGFRGGLQDTFFRKETIDSIQSRVQSGKISKVTDLLRPYLNAWREGGSKWLPPRFQQSMDKGLEQGFQQGGQFVFKGSDVVFGHFDGGTAAHADTNLIVEAALQSVRGAEEENKGQS